VTTCSPMTGLEMVDDRRSLADRLQQENGKILISPPICFGREVAEQATILIFNPSGNALECNRFGVSPQLFAT